MNRIEIRMLTIIALAGALVACGGGQTTEEGGKKPKTEYKISCSGGTAIRRAVFEGYTLREGPVEIPSGSTCSKIKSRTGTAAKKLKRTGRWKVYFRGSRSLLGEGNYVNDERDGVWKYQDKNGKRTRESTYRNDDKNGPETNYFPGSGWKSKGSYVNDNRDGPWQIKLNATTSCISKGSYSNGAKSGRWQDCGVSKSGKVYKQFEGTYSDNMRDGDAIIFHTNGKPLAKGRLRADHACAQEPPQGDIKLCSRRTGDWEIFHPNGKLAWEGGYDDNGKKTGTWTEYYQTGKLMARGSRANGKRVSTWKYYDKNGGLLGEYRFRKSEFLLEYATFYENGKKTGSGPLKNAILKYDTARDSIKLSNAKKTGRWVEYHPGGAKSGEGEYSFGSRKGPWVHYDTSGRKIAEGPYSFNKKHGVWRELQGGNWKTIEYRLGKPK